MKGATAGLPSIEGLVPLAAAGEQGKFLTGGATWAAISTVADPTGHSGALLTNNGTVTSWTTLLVSGNTISSAAAANLILGTTSFGTALTFTSATGAAAFSAGVNVTGKVGVGVAPSSWSASYDVIQVGTGLSLWSGHSGTNDSYITGNSYYNGTNYVALTTAAAQRIVMSSGTFALSFAPSVTAGSSQTFTDQLTVNATTTTLAGGLTVSGTGTSSVAGAFTTAGDLTTTVAGATIKATGTTGTITLRATSTNASAATQLLAEAGDGTTSGRTARVLVQSLETSPQRWDFGMVGDKLWSVRDGTAGTTYLTITNATGVATFASITSGTSTTAAAVLAKSLGLTENLYVGGIASIAGHVTLESVTSTGATGTQKFVFDTSPTIKTPTIVTTSGNVNFTGTGAVFFANSGGFSVDVSGTASTDANIAMRTATYNAANAVYLEEGSGKLFFRWGGAAGIHFHSATPIVAVDGTTASTSTSTGAFTVAGGVGVAGAGFFGGPVVHKNYTVATLPAAATYPYGLAFVTDATLTAVTGLGLAPTGGGANKVPVYSDGTNWLML